MNTDVAIRTRGLRMVYDERTVLDGLDLEVRRTVRARRTGATDQEETA